MKLELDVNSSQNRDADELTSGVRSYSEPVNVKELLRTGITLAKDGSRSEARQLLMRVTEVDPANETAWLWLASISEYPEELLVFLQNILNINPVNERALEWLKATKSLLSKTLVQRGINAFHESQKDFAKQCFLQAIVHDNENEMAWLWLASASDSTEEKMSNLQRVLNINPDNETALTSLKSVRNQAAQTLLKKANSAAIGGDRDSARKMLDEVMQQSPELEGAWILQAYLLDDFYSKIACYEKALTLNPANDAAKAGLASLQAIMQRTGELKPDLFYQSEPVRQETLATAFAEEEVPETETAFDTASEELQKHENSVVENSAVPADEIPNQMERVFDDCEQDSTTSFSFPQIQEPNRDAESANDPGAETKREISPAGEYEHLFQNLPAHRESFSFMEFTDPHSNTENVDLPQTVMDNLIPASSSGENLTDSFSGENHLLEDRLAALTADLVSSDVYSVQSLENNVAGEIAAGEVVTKPAADAMESEDAHELAAKTAETEISPPTDSIGSEQMDLSDVQTENFETESDEPVTAGDAAEVELNIPSVFTLPEMVSQPEEADLLSEIAGSESNEVFILRPEPNFLEETLNPPAAEFEAEKPAALIENRVESFPAEQPSYFEEMAAVSAEPVKDLESLESQDAVLSDSIGPTAPAVIFSCPFCEAENEQNSIVCHSCRAMLTLSDLEMILSHQETDQDVILKAVERLEIEKSLREFDTKDFMDLGIAHINAKNLRKGYSYLDQASRLNPNDVVLSSKVNFLAIRLSEIEDQETKAIENPVVNKTILVVDDSPTVRKLISGKLEKCGHSVISAVDGMDALAKMNEIIPDLVLLDITMPRLDGYQVCKLIRNNEITKNIPIVMISGKDGFFDKVRGRMAGSSGYITKPFGPDTLMKTIETYIS